MKKISLKLVALVVGLISCLIMPVTLVFAEGEPKAAMTVSPMTQKLILMPGESVRASVNISNPNDSTVNMDYAVSVGSFVQRGDENSKDDYEVVDVDQVTSYNQIMDWIVLDKDHGSVAPNEVDTVSFTINVPKDAPAGGQYATIVFRDDTNYNNGSDGNVSIQSITQIASIIYAEVSGRTTEKGAILENSIPGFMTSGPLEAVSMIRNDGNIHTNATVVLQVWPLFSDEEICTNAENPTGTLVLPETTRHHVENWCKLPMFGIFRAKQTVSIFGEISEVEKTFIVCPIWLIFVVVFIIAAIIIYLFARSKARDRERNADD